MTRRSRSPAVTMCESMAFAGSFRISGLDGFQDRHVLLQSDPGLVGISQDSVHPNAKESADALQQITENEVAAGFSDFHMKHHVGFGEFVEHVDLTHCLHIFHEMVDDLCGGTVGGAPALSGPSGGGSVGGSDAPKSLPSSFDPVEDLLLLDPVELEVGFALIPLVDESQGGDLLSRVGVLRKKAAQDLGRLRGPPFGASPFRGIDAHGGFSERRSPGIAVR